jgi:hypothetical protein
MQNPEKYATLEQKTIFFLEKEEFNCIEDILNDKEQGPSNEGAAQNDEPRIRGANHFEDNLIDELVQSGGFKRSIAEKIIGKEGSLEAKTLHFSQIIKQIKDGLVSVKDLEEQRNLDLKNQAEEQSASTTKRKAKSRIQQKHFKRPEEKIEVLY